MDLSRQLKDERFTARKPGDQLESEANEEDMQIFNVTFEPGCRNFWHIHHAKAGGGQILLCTGGRGWYQEWGKEPRALQEGDVVHIPAGGNRNVGNDRLFLIQIISQCLPYVGYPRSLNALSCIDHGAGL